MVLVGFEIVSMGGEVVFPELICFVVTISQSNSLIFFTNAGFCTFITNSLLNALFVISLIEFL